MVQETFGDTDLIWPISPTVGDIFIADNLYPYEWMSDGRWKNLVVFDIVNPTIDPLPENPWIPEVDGNGDDVIIPVPLSADTATDVLQPLLYQVPAVDFADTPHGVQRATLNSWTMPADGYNDIFVHHTQGGSSAQRGGYDQSILGQNHLLEPYHVPNTTGEMVYVVGNGVGAITNYHQLITTVDLSTIIADIATASSVKYRVTFDHAIAHGSALDDNFYNITVFDEVEPSGRRQYFTTTLTPVDVTSGFINWGSNNTESDWVTKGMSEFRTLPTGSEYMSIFIEVMANNLIRDLTIEIIDPRDPGSPSTRKLSGLAIPATGNKIYTASEAVPGTIHEYDMTDYDALTATWLQSEYTFDHASKPAAETVEPLGMWVRSDGNVIYMCDVKGKVKQFRMMEPFDITTVDTVQESNQWYWDDYYKEFTPVANPIDVHLSPLGDKAYILEDDNIIREYDITAWDISTAVYSGNSIDCTSKTVEAKSFTISRDGYVLIIVYDGAMAQSILDTKHSLNASTWDDGESLIEIDDPKGITFNNDNDKLYVADIPTDVTKYMRISSFEKSG